MRPTSSPHLRRVTLHRPRSQARELRALSTLLVLSIPLAVLALGACDEAERAERAERARPLPKLAVSVPEHVPVRVTTSVSGGVPAGRPSSLLLEIEVRSPVVGIGTEVVGVGGLRVQGGKRLNHGAAGRGRRIARTLLVEASPGSRGAAQLEVSWKLSLTDVEHRATVAVPLPAR